jgi:hypothetical protein
MMTMRIHMVELLCQVVMGWVLVLKCMMSGACGYVLSCQALNGTALQGPGLSGSSSVLESPRV